MKKIILILFIIIVVLLGISVGGYFIFKDEIDVLQNELEDGNIIDAVGFVIKLQVNDYVQIDDNTYIMKNKDFSSKIDDFMLETYDAIKMQCVDKIILYESKDQTKVTSVNYKQENLFTLFDVQEKAGKGTDFTITFTEKKKDGLKKIIDSKKSKMYDYDIYTYNGKIDIKVKTRLKELKVALEEGDITMERIISKAESDAAANLITATTYKDGGSVIYQYGTYTILKCNKLDGNENVYIGPFGMKYEDIFKSENTEKDNVSKVQKVIENEINK